MRLQYRRECAGCLEQRAMRCNPFPRIAFLVIYLVNLLLNYKFIYAHTHKRLSMRLVSERELDVVSKDFQAHLKKNEFVSSIRLYKTFRDLILIERKLFSIAAKIGSPTPRYRHIVLNCKI